MAFATPLTLIALAVLAALFSSRLTELIRVPAPAVFLIAAATVSDIVPSLWHKSLVLTEDVVSVALVFILFDGGMHIGVARLRAALHPIAAIGVVGTFLTAGALAVLVQLLFGFSWIGALLLGAALAATDPAVVFSILGKREVEGRAGTIIEGESGANDPVGIALVGALVAATTAGEGGWRAVTDVATTFAVQIAVGLALGLALGKGLVFLAQRALLANEALYPLQTAAGAVLIFGVTTLAHGSGFLAVFVAGIMLGDVRIPYQQDVRRAHASAASLGEIIAFTVLGLTVNLREVFTTSAWWIGLLVALLLGAVVRPLAVGPLVWPVRLHAGEKAFVLFAGLKGAVPILLGTEVLAAGIGEATKIYNIIFVVVLASVVIQGGLTPLVARLCRVPMKPRSRRPEFV